LRSPSGDRLEELITLRARARLDIAQVAPKETNTGSTTNGATAPPRCPTPSPVAAAVSRARVGKISAV